MRILREPPEANVYVLGSVYACTYKIWGSVSRFRLPRYHLIIFIENVRFLKSIKNREDTADVLK